MKARVKETAVRLAPFGLAMALLLAGCATTRSSPAPIAPALRAAARAGNPRAQFRLGVLLMRRGHSRRRLAAGVAWIRRAARGNLAVAQDRLGRLYLAGEGVQQNTTLALRWIGEAARRGAPAAQLQLGDFYAAGAYVPLNRARAYYWYSVAAKPGQGAMDIYNIAQVRAFARRRRAAIGVSLSPARRARIARRVAAWRARPSVPYRGFIPLPSLSP